MALTFTKPTGTDPRINGAAVLAVANEAFAGHDRVWVAGEHEGPFVKMLVGYREDRRAVPLGPADLRRYRDAMFLSWHLRWRGQGPPVVVAV